MKEKNSLEQENVVWEGKPTVLAFIGMLACGTLLMMLSFAAALIVSLAPILYFSIFGLIVGAFVIALAFLMSGAYTYILTNSKMRKEYSFFASSIEEVPLCEVTNIVVLQDGVGRLLGFGTLRADTAGTSYKGMVFRGVRNPDEAFKKVFEAWNKAKIA